MSEPSNSNEAPRDSTEQDVQRVIDRDFPPDAHARVEQILSSYGGQPYHREINRVRLAVLKLCQGDLHELAKQVQVASIDYRDVLAAAEYPHHMQAGFSAQERMAPADFARLQQTDRDEYEAWLFR